MSLSGSTTDKILSCILKACDFTPTVVLGADTMETPEICQDNISYLSINELLEKNVYRRVVKYYK